MKKLFFLFFLFVGSLASAQYYLVKKNGEEFHCKVKEITVNEVIYTDTLASGGVIRTVNKSEVLFIRYRNGVKEMFGQDGKKGNSVVEKSSAGIEIEGPILDLGSNDYSVNGRPYNFRQVRTLLLSINDREIDRLLAVAKVSGVFGNILAYSSIPVGYIGLVLGVASLDDAGNSANPALVVVGTTLGVLSLSSNAANIVFKINKRKKITEAIALYNKRVEELSQNK